MKKQRHYAYAAALALLLSLVSCKMSTKSYVNNLPVSELAEEAAEELDHTDFRIAQGDWLRDYVTLPEGTSDYRICFSADGSNLNEFGIWHVTDEQIAPLEATLHTYLTEALVRNREFYDSYIPEETPKLEQAEVRVFGNYVCYAILNSADRKLFFQTIEEELLDR